MLFIFRISAPCCRCVPPTFMTVVNRAASDWPENSVHFEAFQPPEHDDRPPQPSTIVLRHGRVVLVRADTSALTALRAAGVLLMALCENDAGGACECGLLEGEPIHRDSVPPKDARARQFIPCESRVIGMLRLDR